MYRIDENVDSSKFKTGMAPASSVPPHFLPPEQPLHRFVLVLQADWVPALIAIIVVNPFDHGVKLLENFWLSLFSLLVVFKQFFFGENPLTVVLKEPAFVGFERYLLLLLLFWLVILKHVVINVFAQLFHFQRNTKVFVFYSVQLLVQFHWSEQVCVNVRGILVWIQK